MKDNKSIINESAEYGFDMFEENGKLMCNDQCELCSSDFTKEVVVHEKGHRIPRYCNQCVDKYGIINENYTS